MSTLLNLNDELVYDRLDGNAPGLFVESDVERGFVIKGFATSLIDWCASMTLHVFRIETSMG